jgi:hypothetical protein
VGSPAGKGWSSLEHERCRTVKIAKTLTLALAIVVGMQTAAEALFVVETHVVHFQANQTEVRPGTSVTLSGGLWARKTECRDSQTVSIYKDGSLVGSTTTRRFGWFTFANTITATATFLVKFDGAIVGVHPDQKICNASQSTSVRVTVCRPHHHHGDALEPTAITSPRNHDCR